LKLCRDAFTLLALDAGMDEEKKNAITVQGNVGVGRGQSAEFSLEALLQAVEAIALPKSVAGVPVPMTC
jgi:hypothetical protein